MKKTIFTGSGVAIITPFNNDHSINYPKLGELIEWHIQNSTDAIVVCGTTGESVVMTDEEHIECVRYTVEKTAGRIPVIAGAGSNDTAYAIWMSIESKKAGADALLHSTPYYNKTSQKGLIRHFTDIADATDLPVMLYNVPARTGMTFKPETYLELSKHPNIVATKEASGDLSFIATVAALCGEDLDIYSGNDDQILPVMSLGGKGVVSVLANIMPIETHDVCRMCLDNDFEKALELYIKLVPMSQAIFADVNPIPIKEAMNLMGMGVGPCRMPLVEIDAAAKNSLILQMQRIGLLK